MPIYRTDRSNRFGVSIDVSDPADKTVMVGADDKGDKRRAPMSMYAFSIAETRIFAGVMIVESLFADGWIPPDVEENSDRTIKALLVARCVDEGLDPEDARDVIEALMPRSRLNADVEVVTNS